MASRRMINGKTWEDEFFAALPIFSRLVWLGLITACADDQGRLRNNASLIRSKVFPMDDILVDSLQASLDDFVAAGKIAVYEIDGKKIIQILNWWKHQTPQWAGKSDLPAMDGWIDRERYQTSDRKIFTHNWNLKGGMDDSLPDGLPDILPEGLPDGLPDHNVNVNVNVNENVNDKVQAAAVYSIYENNIGMLSGIIAEKLDADIMEYTDTWVIDAIEESVRQEKRSLAYVEGILKRWKRDGKNSGNKKKSESSFHPVEVYR